MMHSLFSAVSGLRTHQIRMDVLGNNIANVNTLAFKRGRANFSEVLGRQMVGGDGGLRGTLGNGTYAASIQQAWSQGSFEYTNIASDLALAGDGFFLADGGNGHTLLTRAGNFLFDAEGRLVTQGGLPIQGWPVQNDGSVNLGALQDVRIDFDATSSPTETSTATVAGNLSADAEIGDTQTVSSVVYDNQGQAHTLVVTLEKTAEDEWTVTQAELAGYPDAEPPVPPTPLGGVGTVFQFDTDGTLIAPDPAEATFTGIYPNSNGDDVNVTFAFGGMTQFGGSTTAAVTEQDGLPAGELMGYGFDQEGRLILNFTNGEQRAVAQLAIGTVNNPSGLEQFGDNFYGTTVGSGSLLIGRAGQEINTTVNSGALEMSNVDLATEFTDLIVTQRGYQASARVITTSDELLQELVQLKR